MPASKMAIFTRVLALGAIVTGIVAEGPMSEHEHTETALPQEIGTMTSDGLLVYSMNHCVITMTTNCEVSLSTGPPAVETPGETSVVPGEGTDVPYPVPTGEPTDGEPGEGEPTPTEATGSPSTSGDITATETGDSPSPTDGEDGGTATESVATGTSTAGAAGFEGSEAGVFAIAGMVAAYLV